MTEVIISRVDSPFASKLFVQNITEISLYSSKNNVFGFNSKFVIGNNADYNVFLEGNKFDIRKRYVNEIKLRAKNISDSDIKYLKINTNGSIFVLLKTTDKSKKSSAEPDSPDDINVVIF